MTPCPKYKPWRSEAYREQIRSSICLKCEQEGVWQKTDSVAHHESFGLKNLKGMGSKVSDMYLIPLCHAHHMQRHRESAYRFWGDDLKYIVFRCMNWANEFLSLNKGKKI